jgi:hypothetical protein
MRRVFVGDFAVGIETAENDYRLLLATTPLPRFFGYQPLIDALRRSAAPKPHSMSKISRGHLASPQQTHRMLAVKPGHRREFV